MDSIYSKAEMVLVWLGCPPDPTSSEAMIMPRMQLIAELRLSDVYDGDLMSRPKGSEEVCQALLGVGNIFKWYDLLVDADGLPTRNTIDALKLLNLPYWNRLWIVQEIILARNIRIVYGHDQMGWEELESFLHGIESFLTRKPDGKLSIEKVTRPLRNSMPRRLIDQRKLYYQGRASLEHSMLPLFAMTEHSHFQDPKDRVYGLLSLRRGTTHIKADYSKSLFNIWQDCLRMDQGLIPPARIILYSYLTPKALLSPGSATSLPGWIFPGTKDSTYQEEPIYIVGLNVGVVLRCVVRPDDIDVSEDCGVMLAEAVMAMEARIGRASPPQVYSFIEQWKEQIDIMWTAAHETLTATITSSSTSTNKTTASTNDSLRFFVVDGLAANPKYLGIAPKNFRNNDVLCRFEDSDVSAIFRK